MRKIFFCVVFMTTTVLAAMATNVKVTMNAISTTMTVAEKTSGTAVDVGTPASKVYNFEAAEGTYVLTAYDTDSTTVNGTIEFTVGSENVELTVYTVTAYATACHEVGHACQFAQGYAPLRARTAKVYFFPLLRACLPS